MYIGYSGKNCLHVFSRNPHSEFRNPSQFRLQFLQFLIDLFQLPQPPWVWSLHLSRPPSFQLSTKFLVISVEMSKESGQCLHRRCDSSPSPLPQVLFSAQVLFRASPFVTPLPGQRELSSLSIGEQWSGNGTADG